MIKKLVVKPDKTFYQLLVGVQEGYCLTTETLYLFEDNETETEAVKKMDVGADVTVEAHSSDDKYYTVTKITELIHFYCPKCCIITKLDVHPDDCKGCVRPKQERLVSKWELTQKRELPKKDEEQLPAYKLYLKQDKLNLCHVAFPNRPFYDVASKAKVGDSLLIDGWRDDQRRSTIWKLTKSLKRKRVVNTD